MLWVSNFNSIKVQLEQIASEEGYLALTLFQFHKGTIRTKRNQAASRKRE